MVESLGEHTFARHLASLRAEPRREVLGGEFDEESVAPTAATPVEYARTLLGTRYEWGGMTAAGIDCSGLVHISFERAGWIVPRDADQQEAAGEKLSEADLRNGR